MIYHTVVLICISMANNSSSNCEVIKSNHSYNSSQECLADADRVSNFILGSLGPIQQWRYKSWCVNSIGLKSLENHFLALGFNFVGEEV